MSIDFWNGMVVGLLMSVALSGAYSIGEWMAKRKNAHSSVINECQDQSKVPINTCPKCGLFNYACKCPKEQTKGEKTN